MASQGESCDEWESEACQQGGAGTLRSMAGAWEKAGVEIRSRRGLSFALLFPYSLFLIPWGGEAPERAPLSLGNGASRMPGDCGGTSHRGAWCFLGRVGVRDEGHLNSPGR